MRCMTKREWTAIAETLGALREEIRLSWPPANGFMANAPDVADRKLYKAAQLEATDRAARAMCHAIKKFSTRFNARQFLSIIRVGRD